MRASRAVPHPNADRALRRLTSEVRKDPVYSTRYGRQRFEFCSSCSKHFNFMKSNFAIWKLCFMKPWFMNCNFQIRISEIQISELKEYVEIKYWPLQAGKTTFKSTSHEQGYNETCPTLRRAMQNTSNEDTGQSLSHLPSTPRNGKKRLGLDTRIPFGDHPLKLERYRED